MSHPLLPVLPQRPRQFQPRCRLKRLCQYIGMLGIRMVHMLKYFNSKCMYVYSMPSVKPSLSSQSHVPVPPGLRTMTNGCHQTKCHTYCDTCCDPTISRKQRLKYFKFTVQGFQDYSQAARATAALGLPFCKPASIKAKRRKQDFFDADGRACTCCTTPWPCKVRGIHGYIICQTFSV